MARLLTIWLKPHVIKSAYCISTTGTKPSSARPIAAPSAPLSMMGVLRMRSAPKRSRKPAVVLKTPPYSATSWPRSTVRSSASKASPSPSETASMKRTSARSAGMSEDGVAGSSWTGSVANRSARSDSVSLSTCGCSSAHSATASISAAASASIWSSAVGSAPPARSLARKLAMGSRSAHCSKSASGTYLVPLASSWPRILNVFISSSVGPSPARARAAA